MTGAVSGYQVVLTVGETSTQVTVSDSAGTLVAVREDPRLGAQTIDAALRRWIDTQLAQRNPELLVAMTDWPDEVLRMPIRLALAQLERAPRAAIPVGDDRLVLTVTEAETLLAPEISRLLRLVRTALDDAGGGPVAGIYPSGELARIPPTLRTLSQFGPVLTADPRQPVPPPPDSPKTGRRNGAVALGLGALATAAVVVAIIALTQSHPAGQSQPQPTGPGPSDTSLAGPPKPSGPPGYDMSIPHCGQPDGPFGGPTFSLPDHGNSLAADPGTHRLFIAGEQGVTIVDTTTNTVKNTIPLHNADGIAIDTALHRAYVSSQRAVDGGADHDVLTTIDTTTGTITGQTHTGTAHMSGDETVTVDDSTHLVYLPDYVGGLAQFDPTTNTASYINTGKGLNSVAADSTTHRVYATDTPDQLLLVIDPAGGTVVTTISLRQYNNFNTNGMSYYVAVDSALNRAYVNGGDYVLTIDTTSNTVIAKALTEWGGGLTVDHSTHAVYVTNVIDCSVWQLGPSGTAVTLVAPIGGQDSNPDLAAVSGDHTLYALNDQAVNTIHI